MACRCLGRGGLPCKAEAAARHSSSGGRIAPGLLCSGCSGRVVGPGGPGWLALVGGVAASRLREAAVLGEG